MESITKKFYTNLFRINIHVLAIPTENKRQLILPAEVRAAIQIMKVAMPGQTTFWPTFCEKERISDKWGTSRTILLHESDREDFRNYSSLYLLNVSRTIEVCREFSLPRVLFADYEEAFDSFDLNTIHRVDQAVDHLVKWPTATTVHHPLSIPVSIRSNRYQLRIRHRVMLSPCSGEIPLKTCADDIVLLSRIITEAEKMLEELNEVDSLIAKIVL
ncbi:unnamed protein product [Strongylus vulgaris]|uniref:Reverse transcriptase domain-containing protein n=1 Tax=Strongylus vulgaris TaxID=40348 RepID=A0A3P7J2D5_STRVU|nr:unnamed protein product [Strongylus vulgaris]